LQLGKSTIFISCLAILGKLILSGDTAPHAMNNRFSEKFYAVCLIENLVNWNECYSVVRKERTELNATTIWSDDLLLCFVILMTYM
jgi:hypothetical protein